TRGCFCADSWLLTHDLNNIKVKRSKEQFFNRKGCFCVCFVFLVRLSIQRASFSIRCLLPTGLCGCVFMCVSAGLDYSCVSSDLSFSRRGRTHPGAPCVAAIDPTNTSISTQHTYSQYIITPVYYGAQSHCTYSGYHDSNENLNRNN